MAGLFTVALEQMFTEKVDDDDLKAFTRTLAAVAEWAPGHPAAEVLQSLTEGWSAASLNVDPTEGMKLADFIATPDRGDYAVTTDAGTLLCRQTTPEDASTAPVTSGIHVDNEPSDGRPPLS